MGWVVWDGQDSIGWDGLGGIRWWYGVGWRTDKMGCRIYLNSDKSTGIV